MSGRVPRPCDRERERANARNPSTFENSEKPRCRQIRLSTKLRLPPPPGKSVNFAPLSLVLGTLLQGGKPTFADKNFMDIQTFLDKCSFLSNMARKSIYHAIGNYYLKYSWECFMQKICITYSFIVDNPNNLGGFLLFVGQDQLGQNYQTYFHIWGPGILSVKICITYSEYSGHLCMATGHGQKPSSKTHPDRFRTFCLFSLVFSLFCSFSHFLGCLFLTFSGRPLSYVSHYSPLGI